MNWLDPKKVMPSPLEQVITKHKNGCVSISETITLMSFYKKKPIKISWSNEEESEIIGWIPLQWFEGELD